MTSEMQAMTIPEAALALEVAPATVRRWAKSGRISVIRHPSGRMRVPRAEVERVLKPTPNTAA